MRQCGECSLCCKLTPVVEGRSNGSFLKRANERCPFQQAHKGCKVYNDLKQRPRACFIWRCQWLDRASGTENMPRPDRSGFVIDPAPDMLTLTDDDTGKSVSMPAVQIWVGNKGSGEINKYLRAYMEHIGKSGKGVILRHDERMAFVGCIFDGRWNYKIVTADTQSAPADIARVWREYGLA